MSMKSGQSGRTLGITSKGKKDDKASYEISNKESCRESSINPTHTQVIKFEIHVDATIGT